MVNASILANNTNITTFDKMFQLASQITDYWIANIILLSFFMLLLLGFGLYRKIEGLAAASFLTFLLASFFFAMNAVSGTVLVLIGVLFITSATIVWKNS